jgi:hypothetical protein
MPGGGVFGRVRSDKCEHVCFMFTRVVLEPDRNQRVCVMPGGGVVFRGGLRIDCRLLVHRRILRSERRRVHGVFDDFNIFAGKSDGGGLWMRRQHICNYYSNSEHTMEMRSW